MKKTSVHISALSAAVLTLTFMFVVALTTTLTAQTKSPADLDDLEIAHVAYTADNIDIRYAYLALAKSKNPAVLQFAQTMVNDHTAVNDKALALLKKLKASPKDNFLSKQLNEQADKTVKEISCLTGKAFDEAYAKNELAYHKAVNGLVGKTFIPNLKNPEVKALFQEAFAIFQAHEKNAEKMVASVAASN